MSTHRTVLTLEQKNSFSYVLAKELFVSYAKKSISPNNLDKWPEFQVDMMRMVDNLFNFLGKLGIGKEYIEELYRQYMRDCERDNKI